MQALWPLNRLQGSREMLLAYQDRVIGQLPPHVRNEAERVWGCHLPLPALDVGLASSPTPAPSAAHEEAATEANLRRSPRNHKTLPPRPKKEARKLKRKPPPPLCPLPSPLPPASQQAHAYDLSALIDVAGLEGGFHVHSFLELAEMMVAVDTGARVTANAALRHAWFQSARAV